MDKMIKAGSLGMQSGIVQKTVGQYLFDCLKLEGITEIFGVAGDYNFTLLDTLECYNGIRFIEGRNELNSGFAAGGYARIKGMSALITTFGVGELSACNAIAGANSEHVPIIHIRGAPPEKDQKEHKLMHHTLMDGNFEVFCKVYEQITAYTAVLTPENAKIEIPAAIRIAKDKKKPVYLVVANDLVTKPIKVREEPVPLRPTSNLKTLQAAVNHARRLLERAHRPVILVDVKTIRFGLQTAVRQLAEAFGGNAFTVTVRTYGELDQAIIQAETESAERLCIIEMIAGDPMDAPNYMRRQRRK